MQRFVVDMVMVVERLRACMCKLVKAKESEGRKGRKGNREINLFVGVGN